MKTLWSRRFGHWTVAGEVKVADLWVGAFWKSTQSRFDLWLCLLPCLPVHLSRYNKNLGEKSMTDVIGAENRALEKFERLEQIAQDAGFLDHQSGLATLGADVKGKWAKILGFECWDDLPARSRERLMQAWQQGWEQGVRG